MTITLATPSVAELPSVLDALRAWQVEGDELQLHPGDIGWFARFGEDATAAALRTWSKDGRILALGFLDGPDILRFTTAPDVRHDAELAERVASDVDDASLGILPSGGVNFEAPNGALIRDALSARGWALDEAWIPLHRDLSGLVEYSGIRVETVDLGTAAARVEVQRAAFGKSRYTVEAWQTMTASVAYGDARDLIAYDADGNVVAGITVWSAGQGRPGLIEPLAGSPEFRGRGYGKATTLAGAAALRELGASSVLVCTMASLVGAVATYKSAGFTALPERLDLVRA